MRSADIYPGVRIFGLTVISKTVKTLSSGRRMPAWSLKCDCGRVIVAMTVNITKGKHQSCGCRRTELMRSHYPCDTSKPEYRVYRQMLDRCYLETAPNFRWYGAQGVTVCDRWRLGSDNLTGFQCFMQDMGPRPEGLTLERDDPRLPYEPNNCRWATWAEQSVNRREHHLSPLERAALRKKRSEGRRGERAPAAILKDAQVAAIKRRIAEGARTSDLARQFNVSPQAISGIKAGRNWSHVTTDFKEAAE
jgi:hypothetical protein